MPFDRDACPSTSRVASIATGWSDPIAGWELHPLKTNTFHTAHTKADTAKPKGRHREAEGRHREAATTVEPISFGE